MKRFIIDIQTNGDNEIIDLGPLVNKHSTALEGVGLLHLFIPGSTAAITTIEFEPGLVKHDLPAIFQRLAPDDGHYFHEQTWNDDNGHSHVRAAIFGPGVTLPFENGKLLTGQWQQVVLIDFDTSPRRRKIICTAMV